MNDEFSRSERAIAHLMIVDDAFHQLSVAASEAFAAVSDMTRAILQMVPSPMMTTDRRIARRYARTSGGRFVTLRGRPRVYAASW